VRNTETQRIRRQPTHFLNKKQFLFLLFFREIPRQEGAMSSTPVTAMGGRERTQEKQEQMERFKRDSKLAAAMSVCDVEALKVC
jgi:hypothetical protein